MVQRRNRNHALKHRPTDNFQTSEKEGGIRCQQIVFHFLEILTSTSSLAPSDGERGSLEGNEQSILFHKLPQKF